MSDQIKMFIAGEEVVSQNEFTINEEMLSASSTILNNCYPKSWELTKDYISNFYYPKDYSRFVLAQGEYLHGNNEFEPLEITGKNLFDVNAGIVGYVKNDGTIGNATDNYASDYIYLGQNVDFTISANQTMNNIGIAFFDNNKNIILPRKDNSNKQIVSSNTGNAYYVRFWVQKTGQTMSINLVISYQVQLELGSTATSYETYNQPTLYYETNVEKKWNSLNIYGNTTQETAPEVKSKNLLCIGTTTSALGLTITKANSSQLVINGTASATGTISIPLINATQLDSSAYTLSVRVAGGSASSNFTVGLPQSSLLNNITMPSSFASKTSSQEGGKTFTTLTINFTNMMVFNALSLQIQLEKNSSATSFVPYSYTPSKPSPDNPSELVSVGYENLISSQIEQNAWNNSNGTTTVYSNQYIRTKDFMPIKSNTIYCLSYIYSNRYGNILYYDENKTFISSINMPSTLTFTTLSNAKYIKLNFYNVNGISPTDVLNILLTEGTQQHSYIPYGKYGIEVKTTGKNLFDEIYPSIETSVRYKAIYVGEGTFTMSTTMPYASTYTNLFFLTGNVSSGASTGSNGVWNARSRTITSTNGYVTVGYRVADNISPKNYNTQIEKGTQKTTYEEYKSNTYLYQLNEPLRAVGEYKDRLYIENGMLYVDRKIGKIVLNGSEGYNYESGGRRFTTTVSGSRIENTRNPILSNYFRYGASGNADGIAFNYGGAIYLYNYDYNTTTDFKNWLSTHNTEVNYVLATPYIEELGQVDMPISYVGVNNVNIYTGLNTRSDIWYYWKNYDVIFAGIVKNSGDISLNPRHPHYCSLQILDYKTFLSESNTLDFVIANKTISEAIEMVVNSVKGYGFIVGNIDIDSANDIIGAYSTLNKTAYDVLQYLAEISGSRWRARVVDSLTMAIDFYDPDTLPQADDIEYTQEYFEDNNIVDLIFNYGTRDYRNKQILLSDEVYANINYEETLISNGYSNTFTVQNNIGDIVSIIVDGAEKTIGTNNDKQMGVEADFYYTPGKNIVESNSVYSAGTMIHLTYQPLVKGRQVVYNNNEVDRISQQTQTNGVIARYETRNDVLSSDELEKIAQTYIEYKGKAEVILTLTTQNKDLYNIGEVVYFNAPISDLAQNYMVKSKKTEYVVIDKIINLFYIYEMTSSFNSEKAINYFDNQRSKATGNIEEGESITRNVDIETEANIIWSNGNVSSATVTVTGDNVLNCALNSPFVE